MLRPFGVVVAAYLLGCLVAAYYVVRALDGSDIRGHGSGNAGARNVARSHGRVAALATFAVDAAKAALAVLLAWRLLPTEWSGMLAVLGVVVGHVFPVQLGFRGGKGVAPALGGFLAVSPLAVAWALLAGLLVLAVTRRFTLSGLCAVAVAPAVLLAMHRDWHVALLAALTSALILAAHHPRLAGRAAVPLPGGAS